MDLCYYLLKSSLPCYYTRLPFHSDISMQWWTLVKRERYYFNVFMSSDLTGLCLYILQVKPIGNYKVRESTCPKQKEFWDIMRYNVQFWDTTQQRISLRYFKLFQASWDQLMSPISPVVFKNLMIYYFKVSKIQKKEIIMLASFLAWLMSLSSLVLGSYRWMFCKTGGPVCSQFMSPVSPIWSCPMKVKLGDLFNTN